MRIEELLHAAMVRDYTRSDGISVVQSDGPGDTRMPPDPTETSGGSDVQ